MLNYLLLADNATQPTPPGGVAISQVESIYWNAVKGESTFLLLSDGTVKVLGYYDGQKRTSPYDIGLTGITSLKIPRNRQVVNIEADCIFFRQGSINSNLPGERLYALGYNGHNQLGTNVSSVIETPIAINLPSQVISIFPLPRRTFFKAPNSTLYGIGNQEMGVLLNGEVSGNASTIVQCTALNFPVGQIEGSVEHTLVLYVSPIPVQAIGYNQNGQLGNGNWQDSATLVDTIGLLSTEVSELTCISTGNYASSVNGTLAWGGNFNGRLGIGTALDTHTPALSCHGMKIQPVSSWGIYSSGAASLVGGQLTMSRVWQGFGYTESVLRSGVKTFASSPLGYTLIAIDLDGSAWGIGVNSGRFGDGSNNNNFDTFQQSIGISNATNIILLENSFFIQGNQVKVSGPDYITTPLLITI